MTAAARPPLPLPARLASSLLVVFAVAKILLLALRTVDGAADGFASAWTIPALLFHDVWAALALLAVFAGLARFTVGRWAITPIYIAVATWVALNVPIARVFSTPLTAGMLAAAGTAIADSIRVYLTAGNLVAMAVVLWASVRAPRRLARAERPGRAGLVALGILAVAVLVLGPIATRRLPVVGLHRNALGAMAGSLLDRRAEMRELPPETPLDPEGEATDLSHFAGMAAGRNVVWINLESTAAQYLPAWGAARDPTPYVSALGRGAWTFEHVYAAYPESIKGLFAMLCAAAPAAHTDADRYTEARRPCEPIAARLRDAGYRTALYHSGWFAYLGMQGIVDARGFDALVDAGGVPSRFRSSFGVDETSTVDRALAWIDAGPKGRPFFLMYLPIAGHHPYNAPGPPDEPRPFGRGSDFDEYSNDLARGDRAIARLVDGIRARGLDGRTLFVIVGDHGEAFRQHAGNFAHTLFLFEENVHVPLFVRAPGVTDAPLRAPQIGSTIDVAPTVLALLGLPAPARWQGRSLLDPAPGVARFFVDQAVWQAGLRSGPWKLLLDMETGRAQLFHLPTDHAEEHDLTPEQGARVRRYREHLAAWAVRQRSLFAR